MTYPKEKFDESCSMCGEMIANPICSGCLSERIETWNPEIETPVVDEQQENDKVKCTYCGEGMSICVHCFCHDIYLRLMERDENKAHAFLSRFDFGMRNDLAT